MHLQPTRNKKTSEQIGKNKTAQFTKEKIEISDLNKFDSKISQEWKYHQDEAPFICSNK